MGGREHSAAGHEVTAMTLPRVLCAALAALPAAALPCGACLEDKVAATYDHAVVERAAESRRLMVFTEMRGPVDPATLVRKVKAAALRVPAVDRASVRANEAPLTLSFALDRGVAPKDTVAAIEKAAAVPGLKVTILKVLP